MLSFGNAILVLHRWVKTAEPWGVLFAVIGLGLAAASFWIERQDRKEDRINRALANFAAGIGRPEALDLLRRSGISLIALRAPDARLPEVDLAGLDITDSDFSGAFLPRSILTGVKLARSNLQDANISGADGSGGDLSFIDARRLSASGTRFAQANLSHADLSGATVSFASFQRADLSCANLRGASASSADFTEAQLSYGEDFSRHLDRFGPSPAVGTTRCSRLNSNGANLSDANLLGATFDNAVLVGTKFDGATLISATFQGADLRFASLFAVSYVPRNSQAGIGFEKAFIQTLKTARLCGTIMPDMSLCHKDCDGKCPFLAEESPL